MQRWVSTARPLAWPFLLAIVFGSAPEWVHAQAASAPSAPALSEADPNVVPILKQAQSLLADKKAGDAYALLVPHELDLGGTPLFDYLLGLAALDSGHPADAAFALERVVAAQPDFAGARIELARAQFEGGDLALSRTQF